MQDVLPACQWAALITGHDRMLSELKKNQLTSAGLLYLLDQWSDSSELKRANWDTPQCIKALRDMNKEELIKILRLVSAHFDSTLFFLIVNNVDIDDYSELLVNIAETPRCSFLFQWMWNRTKNPSLDAVTADQIHFLTVDAARYGCIETFARLAPKCTDAVARLIVDTVQNKPDTYVYKTLFVYFPQLFSK